MTVTLTLTLALASAWERADSASAAACSSDVDCSLNGICRNATCECAAGWRGAACAELRLGAATAAYGAAPNRTSWGAGVLAGDDGTFHMFVSEIDAPQGGGACGLGHWKTNSLIAHATAQSPRHAVAKAV